MLFLVIFILLFEFSLHARLPLLGHDNAIWMDQLIVGKWHFAHQGLAIQRYSPQICAGTPVYGNPESLQYSLAQFLSYGMHPWWAMQIGVILALVAGYWGWNQFGKKVMGLQENWSRLLAFVMIANGFIFIHLAAGHFQMHTMPLLGCFLLLLFDRAPDSKMSLVGRAASFALLALYTLMSAGYNVFIFAGIVIPFVLLFDLILSQDKMARFKLIAPRILLSGAFSLLVCLSKLVAVFSFMKYFPRVEGYSHMWQSTNIFTYIGKAFWSPLPTRDSIAGYGWDLHEKTVFLSPVTWVGLLLGIAIVIQKKDWLRKNFQKTKTILVCGIFAFLFMIQLAQGNGFLVDGFLKLPVVSSLRVASRFLYILSIFVSMLSVYCISMYASAFNDRTKKILSNAGIVLTILTLGTGWYAVREKLFLNENYAVRTQQLETLANESFENKEVNEVMEGNTDFVRAGTVCHVELMKNSYPLPLIVGEVKLHYSGAFNLINPACYQYPTENSCKPGDRIREDDLENFENFRKGLPVSWKISTLQRIADCLSLCVFLALFAFTVGAVLKRRLSNP